MKGLDDQLFQILFPARITAQKDPLLMVDVAARLRERGLRFQIHVLGEGDLTPAVKERIADGGAAARGASCTAAVWMWHRGTPHVSSCS